MRCALAFWLTIKDSFYQIPTNKNGLSSKFLSISIMLHLWE